MSCNVIYMPNAKTINLVQQQHICCYPLHSECEEGKTSTSIECNSRIRIARACPYLCTHVYAEVRRRAFTEDARVIVCMRRFIRTSCTCGKHCILTEALARATGGFLLTLRRTHV